jgi:rhodanese-related sulfurtransferase
MIRKLSVILLGLVSLGLAFLPASYADEMPSVPKAKQNSLGLYMTSKQVDAHMKTMGAKTLFLDIRDPVEIHVLGMPKSADANVPFKLIDTTKWDGKKGKFKLKGNPNFLADVEASLKAKGLSKDDQIIAICGSGKRAAKTVNALAKAGYKNAYSVTDGYKGWTGNKLPVDKKLDRNKIYGNPQ